MTDNGEGISQQSRLDSALESVVNYEQAMDHYDEPKPSMLDKARVFVEAIVGGGAFLEKRFAQAMQNHEVREEAFEREIKREISRDRGDTVGVSDGADPEDERELGDDLSRHQANQERHPQRWFDREGNQITQEHSEALAKAGGPRPGVDGRVGDEIARTTVDGSYVITSFLGHDYTNEVDRPYNFELVVMTRDDYELMDFFPNEKEALRAHDWTAQALRDGLHPIDIVPRDERLVTLDEREARAKSRESMRAELDPSKDELPIFKPRPLDVVSERDMKAFVAAQLLTVVAQTPEGDIIGRDGGAYAKVSRSAFDQLPKLGETLLVNRGADGRDVARPLSPEQEQSHGFEA